MSKENVILIDYDAPDDWEFHRAVEKATGNKWSVYKAVSNENHGGALQKLIRYKLLGDYKQKYDKEKETTGFIGKIKKTDRYTLNRLRIKKKSIYQEDVFEQFRQKELFIQSDRENRCRQCAERNLRYWSYALGNTW